MISKLHGRERPEKSSPVKPEDEKNSQDPLHTQICCSHVAGGDIYQDNFSGVGGGGTRLLWVEQLSWRGGKETKCELYLQGGSQHQKGL